MNLIKPLRTFALLAVATLGAATLAQAQVSTWKIDPVHSGIEFKITHLTVSKVHGSLGMSKTEPGIIKLDEKDITKSSVEATIDASTINTNDEGRDKHLKTPDFFNVAQFPTLTFKSTGLSKANGKLTMTGDLTMVGVTKPVTLTLDGPAPAQTDAKGNIRSGFSASGTIHRKDFNFGSKYPAAALGDDVQFTIDIEMDKQ